MADDVGSSPLIPPSPIAEPSEIDLEAGPGEQIQCRICLETDGILSHHANAKEHQSMYIGNVWTIGEL